MNNIFDIFKDTTDEELLNIYNDVILSEKEGVRPRSLDEKYSKKLMETCHMNLGNAATLAEKLYYKEIAKRYFENKKEKN